MSERIRGKRSIAVGLPSYGAVDAGTVSSLLELLELNPWRTPELDADIYIGTPQPYVGPYVQNNVHRFLSDATSPVGPLGAEWILRIDCDIHFGRMWVQRFLSALARAERKWGDPNEVPICIGGVYVRRRRSESHVPCVGVLLPLVDGVTPDQVYLTWAAGSLGRTTPASRVGGGFVAFSRAAARSLTYDDLRVDAILGEDYRSSWSIADQGGYVAAVWPDVQAPLLHGQLGANFGIEDYLHAAAVHDCSASPKAAAVLEKGLYFDAFAAYEDAEHRASFLASPYGPGQMRVRRSL